MVRLPLGNVRRFGDRHFAMGEDCLLWATEATELDRKAVIGIARAFKELGREIDRSAALMVDCQKTLERVSRLVRAPRCDGWFERFLLAWNNSASYGAA